MKLNLFKAGFTLVEVNLAIFVMATGVLSMCGLYALGYRENSQSIEDVEATAYADVCLAPLVAALSSPLLTYEDWQKIGDSGNISADAKMEGVRARWPANGWRDYVEFKSENNVRTMRVKKGCSSTAADVYKKIAGALTSSGVKVDSIQIPQNYKYGIVVTRYDNVVQISFRCARRAQSLMSQPIFVAEVNYQGGFGESSVKGVSK